LGSFRNERRRQLLPLLLWRLPKAHTWSATVLADLRVSQWALAKASRFLRVRRGGLCHSESDAACSCSRRIRRSHALRDLGAPFTLDDSNVVLTLQIEPELGTISKIPPEPDGCVCSDRPASIKYVRDATGRYAKIECEPICAELTRF
jgi:hypothetical protein